MKITGIILSGGKSKRMGSDKGFIEIEGKPMIQHVIEHVWPLCDQLLISTNREEYNRFGFPVIPDVIDDAGPAGGIISCLPEAQNEKCIIISCDLPYASTTLLKKLISVSDNHDITIPISGSFLQPLCGIYKKHIFKGFTDLVEAGQYSMQKLIHQFSLNIVNQGDLKDIDLHKELKNINNKSDLDLPNS